MKKVIHFEAGSSSEYDVQNKIIDWLRENKIVEEDSFHYPMLSKSIYLIIEAVEESR